MSLNPQNMIEQLKDSTKDIREEPYRICRKYRRCFERHVYGCNTGD